MQAELQGATEMLDSMQQMASSSMEGQEEAQKQMDTLTAQLQAAIQVTAGPFDHAKAHGHLHCTLQGNAKLQSASTWPQSICLKANSVYTQ